MPQLERKRRVAFRWYGPMSVYHISVLCRNIWFLAHRLPSVYPTVHEKIRISLTIKVLPSETLVQTLIFLLFRQTRRSSQTSSSLSDRHRSLSRWASTVVYNTLFVTRSIVRGSSATADTVNEHVYAMYFSERGSYELLRRRSITLRCLDVRQVGVSSHNNCVMSRNICWVAAAIDRTNDRHRRAHAAEVLTRRRKDKVITQTRSDQSTAQTVAIDARALARAPALCNMWPPGPPKSL